MSDPVIATLADGTELEFPAGTPDDVVDAAVRKHVASAPPIKDGVTANREFEQSFPRAPEQPHVAPNSPRDLIERGVRGVFGDAAPAAFTGLDLAARATPGVGLMRDVLTEGSPVGGMVGGTIGGLGGTALGGPAGGYAGGVGGATAGGAAAGAAERWFRGAPTTGGDVAQDAIVQGGMQAVAPGVGKALTTVAKPVYRMALRPGQKLVEHFGDVGARGLEEGIPVGSNPKLYPGQKGLAATSAEEIAHRTTQSRNAALQMVQEAEAAGAPRVMNAEIQPALDPIFEKALKQRAIGSDPPIPKLVERSQAIAKEAGVRKGSPQRVTKGDWQPHLRTRAETVTPYVQGNPKGTGITPTRAQVLKETAQDEAAQAFKARDTGAKPSTLDDEAVEAIAIQLQKSLEQRVPEVAGQNQNTKELLGLLQALEKAEARHLGGASGNVASDVLAGGAGLAAGGPAGAGAGLAAARLLRSAGAGATSRGAIAMDRTGKAIGGDRLANATRALAMLLSGED